MNNFPSIVKYQDNAYLVINSFQEPDIETLDQIKQQYSYDIILRKNNVIYLCQKIDDAEIISQIITDKKSIEIIIDEFLSKKENKKIEEVDNYLLEINSDEKIQYDSEISKELLTIKLSTEKTNVDAG
ncbi:hypothetical protein M0P65_06525 [Candidatus Gracilibacteria bacterium]|jgi:hypothetical protein|nr:hypothetical protein [Candidatus Gracilibacteria bacterium]